MVALICQVNQRLDYFIIGQGLAGSALAWELLQRGKSIMVFDLPAKNKASSVAAGLCNPITGKMMAKTWKADMVFPFLESFYSCAGKLLGEIFFNPLPIYHPFASIEEKGQWQKKSETEELREFVLKFHDRQAYTQVVNPLGGIEITHGGYLNVRSWLEAVRHFLIAKDSYREDFFQEEELMAGESVRYKDLHAKKVIVCNGLSALESKWFNWVPLLPLKGETLEVKIQSTPERIFNRGVYLVPSGEENMYKVGSTYQHPPFPYGPTRGGREELQTKLRELIRLPFEIIHQNWGIRPTTPDRRPALGHHPANKNVIIFNGLGTKGVSLAPYFAHRLSDWLEGGTQLPAEVNINRFNALYSG